MCGMLSAIWLPGETHPDQHGAFRGRIDVAEDSSIELRLIGASWYEVSLDGQFLTEGPIRYERSHPEYSSHLVVLKKGTHVLGVHLHWVGETTRMLVKQAPFLWCRAHSGGNEIPIKWKCQPLGGYARTVRRINPQLSWIEWNNTPADPPDWRATAFDDSKWPAPAEVKIDLPDPHPPTIGEVAQIPHALKPMAQGNLIESFGYELDDIPARFTLRDLHTNLPPQGVWRRYDLGRVRLGRPRFKLDLPPGAVVEWAMAEHLYGVDRVTPYISLSTGPSCNFDHMIARGGVQEFCPLNPKGGRYLEVHVLAPADKIKFVDEGFIERTYWPKVEGAFTSGDALLDKIWTMGMESLRACSEDSIIDNPTRERGQWTGDVVSVGMDIAAVGFSDMRVLRRGLTQAGYGARGDGLVSGLTPPGGYLSSYAAQWVDACIHYFELTGDRSLLDEMYALALKNLDAFEPFVKEQGLTDGLGWAFIDWGYDRGSGPIDVAMNMHYLSALRMMLRWCALVEKKERVDVLTEREHHIEKVLRDLVRAALSSGPDGAQKLGYHTNALALRLGLVDANFEKDCVAVVKKHILNCFPNNADAPRLSDPGVTSRQLITPYFSHFAFPALIERGEMDFVLDQYRKCWGWMIEQGATTCYEVFDPRWSHCHQWSGCPTWQMTRYVLGLHPRMDLGEDHYVLRMWSGSLKQASGVVPARKGPITVQWTRDAENIAMQIKSPHPVQVHVGSAEAAPQAMQSNVLKLPIPK
jgi:hypothetical protein